MPAATVSSKKETMAEMTAALLRIEGEKMDVVPNTKEGKQGLLSDADLDVLLDRRPVVFSEWRNFRCGWSGTRWLNQIPSHEWEFLGTRLTWPHILSGPNFCPLCQKFDWSVTLSRFPAKMCDWTVCGVMIVGRRQLLLSMKCLLKKVLILFLRCLKKRRGRPIRTLF